MNIKPIETRYDNRLFRSRTEARWAVFFNTVGLRYEYEKEGYALPNGWYLPDFFLPEIGYWLEVKGQTPTTDEVLSCGFLYDATGFPVLLAIGAPEQRPQILHIPILMNEEETRRGSGTLEPRFFLADDRRNPREFWLTDGQGFAVALGPEVGPDHGKYPLVHSATLRGYQAALSARFERDSRPSALGKDAFRKVAALIFRLIRQQASQEEIERRSYAEGERLGLKRDEVIQVAEWVVSEAANRKVA